MKWNYEFSLKLEDSRLAQEKEFFGNVAAIGNDEQKQIAEKQLHRIDRELFRKQSYIIVNIRIEKQRERVVILQKNIEETARSRRMLVLAAGVLLTTLGLGLAVVSIRRVNH